MEKELSLGKYNLKINLSDGNCFTMECKGLSKLDVYLNYINKSDKYIRVPMDDTVDIFISKSMISYVAVEEVS